MRYSLSEANELCRSALGQLGRAFSEEAAEACGYVSALTSLSTIISIVGAGLIIYGAIAKKKEEETK
ncbi:MAG: hypothetical protein QMD80_01030 [archaeon]|nr:hypothetical protein [archaeon]